MKLDKYNNRLMKIFDIEVNFQRHKQKIMRIKNKNATVQAKKAINSQMELVSTFKRHWAHSQSFKNKQKKKQLAKNNTYIYSNLDRQYKRIPKVINNETISLSRTLSSQQSMRSLRSSSDADIRKQNKRIMEKLLIVQSNLSRQNFMRQYKKTKAAKQRLQFRSNKNKEKIQRNLRRMNIVPQVYFPKVRAASHVNNTHAQSVSSITSDLHRKTINNRIITNPQSKHNSQRKSKSKNFNLQNQ